MTRKDAPGTFRSFPLLVVFCSLFFVAAQEGRGEDQQPEQRKIPTTLAEAHAELERILPAEELAKIDAMPSENHMIVYHFGLGMSIRNSWGLWKGGPLAQHMRELGFTHPDDMSSVILETFWCKRHGKDFRLEERAANAKRAWEAARQAQEEQGSRTQESNAVLQNMMMGLHFELRGVPVVQVHIRDGVSVRFLCPFRAGVFLTVYCHGRSLDGPTFREGYYTDPATGEARLRPDMDDSVARGFHGEPLKTKPDQDFYTQGFYLDLKERKIHRICVKEVNEVYAAVVAGGRAWFAGLTDGKAVLVGVGEKDRITVPLPQEDEIPDLGWDGPSLLAVYARTIYRLTDRQWTLVHSGDILLPRSGLPPQRHGNMVFFRDEGGMARDKRLWWLTMGEQLHLRLLARDTGLLEPVVRSGPGPRDVHVFGPSIGEETSSYCVTGNGDLWACVAHGSFLLRRSKDGRYSAAIAYNSVQYGGDPSDKKPAAPALRVSALAALPDDTLLLAGSTGLYHLKGNELTQELAFALSPESGWTPNTVLALDDRSYVIGTSMQQGVYLLHQDDSGQWVSLRLEDSRDSIVW